MDVDHCGNSGSSVIMMRPAGVLMIVLTVFFAMGALGYAQPQFEDVKTVQDTEFSELRGVVTNGVPFDPRLDVYFLCLGPGAGMAYGHVDTDRDGFADTIRQFGASMVTAEAWANGGALLLGPMRTQAALRAQADIARSIALHILADAGTITNADLTTGEIDNLVDEEIRSEVNQVLRGTAMTGVRIMTVPGTDPNVSESICALVRYEAPLSLIPSLAGQQLRMLPPSGDTAPGSDEGSGGGYTLPPPGPPVGDF
jgi:hypothetical protein